MLRNCKTSAAVQGWNVQPHVCRGWRFHLSVTHFPSKLHHSWISSQRLSAALASTLKTSTASQRADMKTRKPTVNGFFSFLAFHCRLKYWTFKYEDMNSANPRNVLVYDSKQKARRSCWGRKLRFTGDHRGTNGLWVVGPLISVVTVNHCATTQYAFFHKAPRRWFWHVFWGKQTTKLRKYFGAFDLADMSRCFTSKTQQRN